MQPSNAIHIQNTEPLQAPSAATVPLTRKELAMRVALVAIAIIGFVIYTQTGSKEALGISIVAALSVCYLMYKPRKKLEPPAPLLIYPRPEEQLAPMLRIQLDLVPNHGSNAAPSRAAPNSPNRLAVLRPKALQLHCKQNSGEIKMGESRPASPSSPTTATEPEPVVRAQSEPGL